MNANLNFLSMSILLSSAILLSPLSAAAKTIVYPEDARSGDVEADLRSTPVNNAPNSLFINSTLEGNVLTVNGGDIAGSVYASYALAGFYAQNNVLNINAGTIGNGGEVSQGYAAAGNSVDGDSNYNTLNMSGGTVIRAIYGGSSYDGHANYNTVNFSGGITRDITGGFVANAIGTSAASYNTVNITGGTITGNIYGGDSYNADDEHNTVNISGNVNLASTVSIYGGNRFMGAATHNGNTLNLNWSGTISNLGSFEFINLTVNEATVANNNTVLKIMGTGSASLSNSHVRIAAFEGNHNWTPGEQITLISKSSNTNTARLYGGQVQQGLARKLDYDMQFVGPTNAVVATITDIKINDDVADLPTGTGATNEFLKGTADLLDSANLVEEIDGLSRVIGVVKHSRSKFGSDSNATVNGTAMLLGASHKLQGKGGYVMLGGFVEGGWGNYDTHSNFGDSGEINSSGKTNYHGLGFAMRNVRDNGVYTGASVRLGRAFTHHNSSNLKDSAGNLASYDINSMYYGLNLGVGKVINLTDKNKLDVYGKYMFLHQNGSSVTISGDNFNFKAIDSHRLRTGAKFLHKNNKQLDTYLDLAYEYEFSGKASAVTYGVELPYISVKGGTAIAELGITYKPKNNDKFEMKLGVQGYVGKRQGFSGNVQLNWKF